MKASEKIIEAADRKNEALMRGGTEAGGGKMVFEGHSEKSETGKRREGSIGRWTARREQQKTEKGLREKDEEPLEQEKRSQ